jgi:Tol biopolymer transport system component
MGPVVVSPDGKTLAFTAVDDQGITKLWLRPLDAQRATPLAGMEDATYPFWSFDGQYLAFIAEGKLEKISVSGGDAQTLAEGLGTETGRGTWSWMGRSYSAKICLARSIE